jgi:D-alanyl-lipoteichoic acid acyltransferase DltB (MBOAT superfamily)
VNYALALRIETAAQRRAGLLWLGIGLNIALLAWFRYTDFFVGPVSQALAQAGITAAPELLKIGLPVGLSYLVVQMISYLVDVWRGQIPAEHNLVDFTLYAVYFPKITSGPIERARTFLPAIKNRPALDGPAAARGSGLIVAGLVRKLVIANILAGTIPDGLFNKPADRGGAVIVMAVITYGVYLLNDFAGYTSIVRGVSVLMGIELSRNFASPYFARSFSEFWNRWHISFSHWLRDYIYFPVSRALLRRNLNPRWLPNIIIPPLATMLVSGLWHGATPGLMVWGALHGVYQAGERLIGSWRPPHSPDRDPAWRQAISMLVVSALVLAAWIPFRVPWESIPVFLNEMLNWSQPPGFETWRALILIVPALALDAILLWQKDEQFYLRWPEVAQALALATAILLIVMSSLERIRPFVYQAF